MLPLVTSLGLLLPLAAVVVHAREGFIKQPVTAISRPGVGTDVTKRQDALPLSNVKTGTLYTIQISVGTPPQALTLVIDTGSSELWVNPTCSAAPASQVEFCNTFPQFDYTASSTFNDTRTSFQLQYGIGSALVEYVTDVVTLGSAVIKNQLFGYNVDSTEIPLGILGLAPYIGRVYPKHDFVLDTLVSQGQINSRAFSLDLRSVDSPDGSVIFGGVDTKKYTGSLEKRSIIPTADAPDGTDRYWIYLTSVAVTSPAGASASLYADSAPGLPVFLDSGGTLSLLPTPLYQAIGQAFIAEFPDTFLHPESGYYVVDCSVADSPGSLDFGFGAKVINVAYKDVIWNLGQPDLDLCVVGVLPEDDEPVLGDSFLRAAYVVYDQDNRNLHLAQAANCGSNLVAIGKGADAVPSIVGGCGAGPTTTPTTPPSSTTPTTPPTTAPTTKPSVTPPANPPTTSSTTPSTSIVTTPPGPNPTTSSSYPNGTAATTITSTITRTTQYTITSCPPTVTQCPYGHVTTEVLTMTTTFCPGSTASNPATDQPGTSLTTNSQPSLTPTFISTGNVVPTVSSSSTAKPTAVVTAGARHVRGGLGMYYLALGMAGVAIII